MLTPKDKDLLFQKGISEELLDSQLEHFKTGFPFLKLEAPASIGNGIMAPDTDACKAYIASWEKYMQTNHRVVKFVPASGAASRMFKNLFGFLDAPYEVPTTDFEKQFFAHLACFAFHGDLDEACR